MVQHTDLSVPCPIASINGQAVNFATITAGQAAYGTIVAIADDMVADMNLLTTFLLVLIMET